MNQQNIRAGADLPAAEKTIMGKVQGKSKASESDPVALYARELNQLAAELGIDLVDDNDDPLTRPATENVEPRKPQVGKVVSRPSNKPPPRGPSRLDLVVGGIDDIDLGTPSRPHKSAKPARKPAPAPPPDDGDDGSGSEYTDGEGDEGDDNGEGGDEESGSEYTDGEGDEEGGDGEGSEYTDGEGDEVDVDGTIAKLEADLGIQTDPERERRRRKLRTHVTSGDNHRPKSSLTEEQEKRRHINSVIGEMRQETRTSFGAERERVQDIKANKLNQIDQLRMTLEDESIDTSAVAKVTQESPMEEIDSVLNIMRLKNDRNRYSSLANEVLLGFAEGVESVFDGTRSVPVLGWRPDYTGYHNTVAVKLHRMQFETSQIVGTIIEKYNVGPMTRVFMELLPSFFLYPRMQKKQRGSPGLHNDPKVVGSRVTDAGMAMSAIRESDERRDMAAVDRI
jgi:hypothetical protein